MLYKANKDTKRICIKARRNGGDICSDNTKLYVSPLICDEPPQYCYQYSPCGGVERIEIKREYPLTLVYNMFDRGEDGSLCFLLDSQFAELACGRYIARVELDGCEIYRFQIDKRESADVAKVDIEDKINCCEGKYGC